uniref:Uncharacterized protein n=1 Tax=Panagrolaimus sp. ES5 TaxID=591445 RepID=A0AC34FT07_9BILA
MKRYRPSGEEEATASQKQSKKTKNIGAVNNPVKFPATLLLSPNIADSKERCSDNEANGELPSLNDSLENNIASSSSTSEISKIDELEKENIKLKSELSYYKLKQEKDDKKGNTVVKSALAKSEQNYQLAKETKIKADELQKKLQKCQDTLKREESKRNHLQHQLKQAEQNLMAKDEEIKKLVNNEAKLTDDPISNKNLENELRQMLAIKDIAINGLDQKLGQAYKDLENQKDEKRAVESEIKKLENRVAELQETAKTTKEKEDAFEKQIEDLQQELGQQKTDFDQLYYDAQCENEAFELKLKENREAIEQKNQEIAELRKKLDIQEVYDEQVNCRIDVTESKAKNLEAQYIQTRAELHELQVKYADLQKQFAEAKEDTEKIIIKKDEKISALKKDNDRFRKGYRSDKEKYSSATREIEKLKSDKLNLQFEMKNKEVTISKSQGHLENAHQEIDSLKQHLEKTNDELNILKTKEEKNSKNASNIVMLLKEVNEIRESLTEKDVIIADLQKQKDENEILFSQTLNNLAAMEEKVTELQKLYDNVCGQKEAENVEYMKEKEETLFQIEDLQTEIKCLISQKQRLEKELTKTENYLQSTNTELAEEKAEHEKAKEFVEKSTVFINKAKALKDEETLRADEAIARLETFEVQFLQNQSTLKSEQEQRILLQTQIIAFQQQMKETVDSKDITI